MRLVQSLVWQWKCRQIITSLLPNLVFALRNIIRNVALFFKAQSSNIGGKCGGALVSSSHQLTMPTYYSCSVFNNQATNKALKQDKKQFAVFRTSNILANNFLPLNGALVTRTIYARLSF